MKLLSIVSAALVLLLASACVMITPEATTSEPVAETETEGEAAEPLFVDFAPGNFPAVVNIDNEWLPLQPGTQWIHEGVSNNEEGESFPHRIEFTVTDLTKEIAGVRTAVAWVQDISDEQLVEKEIAFYAQDNDGNVWYFGEHPEEYEDGEFVKAPTWLAGLVDARPGLKMHADPQPGMPSYFQGWGPAVEWNDYAHIDEMVDELCVPTGCYQDVMVISESSLGEENAYQVKSYARGVGNIHVGWSGEDATQEELDLVEFNQLDADALAAVREAALALEAHAYEISPDVYGQTAPME